MSVRILIGDVRSKLAELQPESVDCVVTSPPYWGLRDYGTARWVGGGSTCEHILIGTDRTAWANSVKGPGGSGKNGTRWANTTKEVGGHCSLCGAVREDDQIGMEPTLGEHLSVMVEVFDLVRRAMKPEATLWLNYGDCYATKPNGRSAEATKAAGNDDRTFRDKPFSTVGPIYGHLDREYEKTPRAGVTQNMGNLGAQSGPRVVGVGMLKPKDLCMIPNRLAIALQDAGWWVRSEIVWGKPNPMPDSSGRYRPSTAHEKIWLLSKSAKCFYDSEAVRMPAAESSELNPA
jgi:DNA modification methylase